MKNQSAVYPHIAKFLFVSSLGFAVFYLLLFVVGGFIYTQATGKTLEWWILPLLIAAVTTFSFLLFASPFGEWSARHDAKAMSPDKWQKTHSLDIATALDCFEEIKQKAMRHYPSVNSVRLYIAESDCINAFACGKRTIILNSALISDIDREAICGTIAHEFGHIINKDYRARAIYAGIKFSDNILYHVFYAISQLFAYLCNLIYNFVLGFFGVHTNNTNLFHVLCEMLDVLYEIADESCDLACNHLLLRHEYEADKIACCLDYGEGLIDLLQNHTGNTYRLDGTEICDSDTHPTNKNRIEKCNDYMKGSC